MAATNNFDRIHVLEKNTSGIENQKLKLINSDNIQNRINWVLTKDDVTV